MTQKKELPPIFLNCQSLFKDAENFYRCYERTDKTGNILVYGLDNKKVINNLGNHCSLFSEAKKPLKIDQHSMDRKVISIEKKDQKAKEKAEQENTIYTSLILDEENKMIAEQVFDGTNCQF